MKGSIIPALQSNLRPATRLIDNLAKRMLLGRLEKINRGLLQIIDDGNVYEFGDTNRASIKAVITVRSPGFYSAAAFGGSVGAGESYFLGEWDCDNLTRLVRMFLINRDVVDSMDSGFRNLRAPLNKLIHWFNRNTRSGSRQNISAHYDIGNELFELMLDDNMMYSSAIYKNREDTLEQAAVNKLDSLCRKLELNENDHLLEIGSGWGGMAIHAAKHYRCRVTTTTISREQYNYTRKRIREEGLEHRITLLLEDYRDLDGQYDKLVSIEMIEAVGLNNLGRYFEKCSALLKPDGLMCLQAITIEDQRYEQAKREVDFIQKYIFPGGSLPSITAMAQAIMKNSDMKIFDLEDIGMHYAKTLQDWRERFFQHENQVRKLGYNEQFIRLWEYYLCYCEAGFLQRSISTVHILLTKPGYCRTTLVTE